MAHPRRDQEYLGIDTNVLVAYLDEEHPKNQELKWLRDCKVALSPTTIHEAYHTLVHKMRWMEADALDDLNVLLAEPGNLFLNQSLRTTKLGLLLAATHHLGGRDGLILASLLLGGVSRLFTYDRSLLDLKKLQNEGSTLNLLHPSKEIGQNR